jgi:hypothetical protein
VKVILFQLQFFHSIIMIFFVCLFASIALLISYKSANEKQLNAFFLLRGECSNPVY